MSVFAIVGLLFAQTAPITVEASRSDGGVGYRELVSQQPAAAIERIAANRTLDADDPAALLNRGTAELRLGRVEAAHAAYRAALSSRSEYDVQLHGGTWVNSRDAARHAIRLMRRGEALALR